MPRDDSQPNNPLHGMTLASLLEQLVETYGWEELGARIDIRCFNYDPSIKSSLRFLRKTPWARAKVERLYLRSVCYKRKHAAPNDEVAGGDDDPQQTAWPASDLNDGPIG